MKATIQKLIPDTREGYYTIVVEVNNILCESWTAWTKPQVMQMFSLSEEQFNELIYQNK